MMTQDLLEIMTVSNKRYVTQNNRLVFWRLNDSRLTERVYDLNFHKFFTQLLRGGLFTKDLMIEGIGPKDSFKYSNFHDKCTSLECHDFYFHIQFPQSLL